MGFKLIIFFLFMVFSSPVLFAENRIALIIANSNYEHVSTLKNTVLGAKKLSNKLKKLGFTIIRPIRKNSDVQFDLTLKELLVAREALGRIAKNTEMIFLYYAGHGASLGNNFEPYIIPVSVDKPTQDSTSLELLKQQSYSLDILLKGIDNSEALTIAVLDACRDIPELEKTMSMFTNPRGNIARWHGLHRVKNQKKNRFIAYSGAEGQLVADGDDNYSPYTKRLLESLDSEPNLEVVDLFRSVAAKVDSFTGQFPVLDIQGIPPNTFYFIKRKKIIEELIEKISTLIKESKNKNIINCIYFKELIEKSQNILLNNSPPSSERKTLDKKIKIAFSIYSKCSSKLYRSNCKCEK